MTISDIKLYGYKKTHPCIICGKLMQYYNIGCKTFCKIACSNCTKRGYRIEGLKYKNNGRS